MREELARFLDAVDGALARPVEIIVIGGSAAALHYGVERATHDIDTWTTVQRRQGRSPGADPRQRLAVVERLFPDAVEAVARRLRRPSS